MTSNLEIAGVAAMNQEVARGGAEIASALSRFRRVMAMREDEDSPEVLQQLVDEKLDAMNSVCVVAESESK